MHTYARVQDGVVVELFATDEDIYSILSKSLVWVDCTAFADCQYGWTYSNGVFSAPASPTDTQLLADAQAAQTALLSAACGNAITAGFTSSALGAAYTYPAKMTDQQNLTASVLGSLMPNLPEAWTTSFWCADASDVWAFRDHTATQIQQAGQDAKTATLASMTKNQTLAAQVQAATTVQAVQAVVWQ